jgi:hypothetical protein
MFMTNAGSVGIGTTAPTTMLETVGSIHAHDSGTSPDNGYNGLLRVTRPAASGQHINLVRTGQIAWSLGTVYNSNTFGIGAGQMTDSNFTSPTFSITQLGNVGIGSTAPRATLDVNGSIATAAPAASVGAGPVNFTTGNIQYTANSCGTFSLQHMKSGSSYIFIVQGATSATCVFNAFSDGGTTALTVKMPIDHGATTASKHTMYNFIVAGTNVYVSWSTGL